MHCSNWAKEYLKAKASAIGALAFLAFTTTLHSQASQAPPLHPGDKPYILFALPDEMDFSNQPELAGTSPLEPIAFIVHGELRDCYSPYVSMTTPNPGEQETIKQLHKAYTPPKKYPVWLRGTPWGQARAVKSCMEYSFAKDGCFHLSPNSGQPSLSKQFSAIAYTGPIPTEAHQAVREKVNEKERALFLESAAAEYEKHYIFVAPNSIHVGTIWKTRLRKDHTALIGRTLYQFAIKGKNIWSSDRIFLVIEEDDGHYSPILVAFHQAKIQISPDNPAPKIGEILRGEDSYDVEDFLDNFPLFTNEPDAIITEHAYDEASAFSIFRWKANRYELVYTGCGGSE